ncbi:hypothetical protein [Parapedobacter tibetensis]|uniref:hypothetical protein n=1 Tax=Parapedobacter tibetensis TaxID=2972951 RepID=UPI00214D4B5E|nr:hypothetical protein [Parapedobacter tibetensis]
MHEDKRIDQLTKQLPILGLVPRPARLQVHRRAIRHPLTWITLVASMALWFYFFAEEIMAIEIPEGLSGRARTLAIGKAVFFPAVVPTMVICAALLTIRYQLVKRIVKKEYGA